jgi:hypothetical protein
MVDTRHKGPAAPSRGGGRKLVATGGLATGGQLNTRLRRKHPLMPESPSNPAIAEEIRQGIRTLKGRVRSSQYWTPTS